MTLLHRIKVTPLAAESLGVRSMCTLVETPDVTLLLDAGISIAPYRFSLLPHPKEFQTIHRLRRRIAQAAEKARVITISHYHFDHHTPSFEDWLANWTQDNQTARQIYQNKTVLMKNPKSKINSSQRHRAWMFQQTAGRYAKMLSAADGRTFHFGETTIRFSEAVPHGSESSILGWVVMATVTSQGECFMHAPDVQGPMVSSTAELIIANKPDVLMVGGPPFYLGGFKVAETQLRVALANLTRIVQMVPTIILEHHALRETEWRERLQPLFTVAKEAGHLVVTSAEFSGEENRFLEFNRKRLWEEMPPPAEFLRWTRESETRISHVKPPI